MKRKDNLLLLKKWVSKYGTRNYNGYIVAKSIDDSRGVCKDERRADKSKGKD